jgi:hypothetical protein
VTVGRQKETETNEEAVAVIQTGGRTVAPVEVVRSNRFWICHEVRDGIVH